MYQTLSFVTVCCISNEGRSTRWRAKTFVITIEFLKGEFSKLERMGTHVRGKSMIVILQNDEELSIMQHTDQLSHNYLRLLSNLKLSLKGTHCSKSSFFVQKFNFDFPRKLSIFLGWKLVKMLLFWTLISWEKLSKKIGWKTVGVLLTKIWLFE